MLSDTTDGAGATEALGPVRMSQPLYFSWIGLQELQMDVTTTNLSTRTFCLTGTAPERHNPVLSP